MRFRVKLTVIALVAMLVVLYTAAVAPSANAYVVPAPVSGITIMTDGMPTRMTFKVNKEHTRVTCVDIRTAPGKDRTVRFYSSGTLLNKVRVSANHNTPGKCEASFKTGSRRLTVKVQEHILFGKWLGKGQKTLYLW